MQHPVIADNKPAEVELSPDKEYFFCVCGRSSDQPFCDGSHQETEEFQPLAFTPEEEGTAVLCRCKHTGNAPYCDGTHQQFSRDQVGREGPGKAEEENNQAPEAKNTPEEPRVEFIHQLAREGLEGVGAQGPVEAMGVPRHALPDWDDLQLLTAQLATQPLADDAEVDTRLVVGPEAKKPLELDMPLFVSDMSFGALSPEAKLALARGAEMAGTGICSGEGGMLPEEQEANSRYFYELAPAEFGFDEQLLKKVQALHFKAGQAAKTGVGSHLPGHKNQGRVAEVRDLSEGEPAISPSTFKNLHSVRDFRNYADRVREISGGIPIGFKLSANHIEADIQFALDAGADYLILDGRGGGTGAAPTLFRDHISVPTIPALARARQYLDKQRASGRVTLIMTGGLRTPSDFIKALALGADGLALANTAIQALGCVAARICNTNNCPAGITTQREDLRQRLDVDQSAAQLNRFLGSSVSLMQLMARACGHSSLAQFNRKDLTTWHRDLALLSGVDYAGLLNPSN
ncbi:glutamate synthase-related protein [Marinospirillum sp.]|uniref:glutamate synthase-related protein n=1 Tax=Marinospirillum sp. TaxID=2183934 RepID=UPI00286FF506|nr:glutamate synthase-related protein [Marinospirillum sp.]MDR9466883.1 glutamate synthase-related protein [Marinospirillum sp.]